MKYTIELCGGAVAEYLDASFRSGKTVTVTIKLTSAKAMAESCRSF
jgi:hypothetical protein